MSIKRESRTLLYDQDHSLPARLSFPQDGRRTRYLVVLSLLLSFPALIMLGSLSLKPTNSLDIRHPEGDETSCPQVMPMLPMGHEKLLKNLDFLYGTLDFRLHAYESLGGAVRIPTETQDEEGSPDEDPERWEPFKDLHAYLESRFPLVYSNTVVSKVQTYAIVFHWQGTNTTLKPIILTSHQDVVPVEPETIAQWEYPPYSGYYDGEFIWGRGSCDDKSGLIASLTTVETLLSSGFKPDRTVVLAIGIDEERGGKISATALRDYLLETYGKNAFSILIDEGGGYSDRFGATVSMPSVAEKGQIDVRVELRTPGGHSSKPPAHTGIGILSRIIVHLEDNPHPQILSRGGVYYQQIQCLAEHAPELPARIKGLAKKSLSNDEALKELTEALSQTFSDFGPSTGTTQAIDIIHGGVKSNALPEMVFTIVNHRIADYSSVSELKSRFTDIVSPIAKEFNLSISAFSEEVEQVSPTLDTKGHLRISAAYGSGLDPAPVSPTKGSGPWELLSGSIMYTFSTNQRTSSIKTNDYVVAPGLNLGNTDTRYYWDLTKHIFRYGHLGASDRNNGAHTVNEAIRAEGFLEMIRFFTVIILNADKTELLEQK